MTKQILAITTCRVSTPEQEENNSLGRQRDAVIAASEQLGAVIPEDGQWSGSVSSKAGTNTNRTDLKEMLEYCKKHPNVKHLIVNEVGPFMRSIEEVFIRGVVCQLGVKVWYASQPELNTTTIMPKYSKHWRRSKENGSNVETSEKINRRSDHCLTAREVHVLS